MNLEASVIETMEQDISQHGPGIGKIFSNHDTRSVFCKCHIYGSAKHIFAEIKSDDSTGATRQAGEQLCIDSINSKPGLLAQSVSIF